MSVFSSVFFAGTQTCSEQAGKLRRQYKTSSCYLPCRAPLHFTVWPALAQKDHKGQSSSHNFFRQGPFGFFSSFSQGIFPARTNSGLHFSIDCKSLAFCGLLHLQALLEGRAALSGVWTSLQTGYVQWSWLTFAEGYPSSQVQQMVVQAFIFPLHFSSHIHANAW